MNTQTPPRLSAQRQTVSPGKPCEHRELDSVEPLTDAEHVKHIESCRLLMQLARARHRGSHSRSDEAEALRWQFAMNDAIKARQDAQRERQAAEKLDELCFDGRWTDAVVNPAAVRRRISGMA